MSVKTTVEQACEPMAGPLCERRMPCSLRARTRALIPESRPVPPEA
jgi:hypothetical protein